MAENVTLSRNQQRAIAALLSCTTTAEAAEKAGVSRQTLYRYLADETFRAELSRRQDAIISKVTASLVGLAEEIVKTLRQMLTDADTPPSVKARVALGWLSQMQKNVELQDLVERVERLEAQATDEGIVVRVVWDDYEPLSDDAPEE